MVRKTIAERRFNTAYQKKLLAVHQKPYPISVALSKQIGDCLNVDILLKSEIKKAFNNGG